MSYIILLIVSLLTICHKNLQASGYNAWKFVDHRAYDLDYAIRLNAYELLNQNLEEKFFDHFGHSQFLSDFVKELVHSYMLENVFHSSSEEYLKWQDTQREAFKLHLANKGVVFLHQPIGFTSHVLFLEPEKDPQNLFPPLKTLMGLTNPEDKKYFENCTLKFALKSIWLSTTLWDNRRVLTPQPVWTNPHESSISPQ